MGNRLNETKTWEELWEEYDNSETDKIDLSKRSICIQLDSMENGIKKDNLKRELVLQNFSFSLRGIMMYENYDVSMYKEYEKYFVENIDSKSFDYYHNRYNETSSYLNKWTYAFSCWIIKRDKDFLTKSIDALFESISILVKQHSYNEIFRRIMLAYNLLRFYNVKTIPTKFNDILLKIIYDTNNSENARWMIEPIIVLTALNKKLENDLVANLFTILHRNARNFRNKQKSHLEQSLLKVSIRLCDFTNLGSDLKEKLRKEIHSLIGESHELEADQRLKKDEGLGAIFWYKDAQEEYERAENHQKSKLLNQKIREATSKTELTEVRTSISMPKLVLSGNNGFELVNSIIKNRENIPPLNWVKDLTKELMEKYPISSLFRNVSLNEKNPTSYSNDKESIFESRTKQQTIQFIRLAESRLSLAVKKLENEKKISQGDFIDVMKNTGLHDEDQMKIIQSGVEDHFNGRYIASISTLIPLLEGTLRSLLGVKGISILRTKGDIILDSELGKMLSDSKVKELLGEDFVNYLKTKYADPDGINQRNKVSHALSSAGEFNYEASLTLIQTICKLTRLSV